VRRKRMPEALGELRRASELAPGDPAFAYAYAVALQSGGRVEEALRALVAAQKRSPGARSLLLLLVAFNRDRGALREAKSWARQLLAVAPADPEARALAAELLADGGGAAAGPLAPPSR